MNSDANMAKSSIRILMVGDVMLGRGIDQIMPYSCPPKLYEGYVKDARDYVELVVQQSGTLPKQRSMDYIWGYSLDVFKKKKPDLKMINLETSVTLHDEPWPNKGIHYRMHPKNTEALLHGGIDLCVLANNHVLDWGRSGLEETLSTLNSFGIKYVGAGSNLQRVDQPAIFECSEKKRLIIFAGGHMSSGIPDEWQPSVTTGGVNVLDLHQYKTVRKLKEQISSIKMEGDIIILSVHWGGNWGYDIEEYHKQFAHDVINDAGVDVVHGHSSHHVKGIEVYKGKLIIYGCGDWLNDYEGISGYEQFRGDLGLMYFADVNPSSGKLDGLTLVPTQIKKMRITKPEDADIEWLFRTMQKECLKLGTDVKQSGDEFNLIYALH